MGAVSQREEIRQGLNKEGGGQLAAADDMLQKGMTVGDFMQPRQRHLFPCPFSGLTCKLMLKPGVQGPET